MKNIDTMVRSTWLTTFPKTKLTKGHGQILHTKKKPRVALLSDLSFPFGLPEQMATPFPSLLFYHSATLLKYKTQHSFFLFPRTKQQALFSSIFCYQILLTLMPQTKPSIFLSFFLSVLFQPLPLFFMAFYKAKGSVGW